MLSKLRIKNFKSWKDTGEINMAPITMFFGGNSSGKTSLLQFLLMLKQTADAGNYSGQVLNFDGIVNLGNFKDVVRDHENKNAIDFVISASQQAFSRYSCEQISASIVEEQKSLVIKNFHVNLPKKDKKREDLINSEMQKIIKSEDEKDKILRSFKWSGLISDLTMFIDYIGPLRDFPERHYQWKNNFPSEVGKRGTLTIQTIIASNLKNGDLEKKIAAALKKMGLIESFRVKPISKNRDDYYEVKVKKTKFSAEVLLPDVGFGVSQILPIITALFQSSEGATLILEQPEIHLHPKAQIELADVIIDAVKERKIQVIIESHSEHFLTRIQTRIADETISKEFAKLYFCKNEKGFSELEELELNDSGDIKNWPENFFGNQLEESANRVLSYLEKKRSKKKKS